MSVEPPDEKPVEQVIAEHREVFEAIANEVDDPTIAEKYGSRPLRHLDQHDGGDD